jgi:hypothetical protein
MDGRKTEDKPFWTTLLHAPLLCLSKSIFDIFNESEEDAAEDYNVSVYKILPYPPNTKNVKDSFIQRT